MHNLAENPTAEKLELVPRPQGGPRKLVPTPQPGDRSRREPGSSEAPVVSVLASQLAEMGVEEAFGVSGGAVALVFDALATSPIRLRHFRHEGGAAFAAAEASCLTGRPVVVFATTGPGLLNTLTGLAAARWSGAKLILLTGATSSPQRGRWAIQETSSFTMPQDALYGQGPIFDFAINVEHASELPEVLHRLRLGLARPSGFVAHVAIPMAIQSARVDLPARRRKAVAITPPAASAEKVRSCAELLERQSFAIWAGFGATAAAAQVRELAERTGAMIFCSPRAKGLVPEDHPQYLGVTGAGGHDTVVEYMRESRPRRILVLGTRLGETTSFWDPAMVPPEGFLHVDVDREVFGTAYPEAETVGIQAEVGGFLDALLDHLPARKPGPATTCRLRSEPFLMPLKGRGRVRPRVLMQAIQRRVVQGSDALVLSESGSAFAWCNHHLRFPTPGRYRASTFFSSLGHAVAGVVGAAIATGKKSVAVVGDGSMLTHLEVSAAVQYQAPAVWLVLNDCGYGTSRDGHRALGLSRRHLDIPRVDFAELARSLGADGVRVEGEEELEGALAQALAADGPFVVDVIIDDEET